MKFKLRCTFCNEILTEKPDEHLLKKHDLMEFFTLVPSVNWNSFDEPKKDVIEKVDEEVKKLKPIKKKVRKEEPEPEEDDYDEDYDEDE